MISADNEGPLISLMGLLALSILYQGVVSGDNIYFAFTNLAWPESVVHLILHTVSRCLMEPLEQPVCVGQRRSSDRAPRVSHKHRAAFMNNTIK